MSDFKSGELEFFNSYVLKLKKEQKYNKQLNKWENKNEWALKKPDNWYMDLFKKNQLTKLPFDGVHITVNQNGLSYDYVAYKNRLLLAYPETKISFSEVYQGDDFSFSNNSDGVAFKHVLANPFNRDTKNIIGCYCVIKNKRGEFLTLLDKNEIAKHRAIAKTDTIWKLWELEMIYKTIIKKATRIHYEDVYTEMNDEDNQENEIETLMDKKIDKFLEIKELVKELKIDEVEFLKYFKVAAISELNFEDQDRAMEILLKKKEKKDKK